VVRVIYSSSRARHVAIGSPFVTCANRSRGPRAPNQPACQPKLTRASARERRLVGLTRFELVTPRLSSVCSNQLSYRPQALKPAFQRTRLRQGFGGQARIALENPAGHPGGLSTAAPSGAEVDSLKTR
jgi:hypothetical protein